MNRRRFFGLLAGTVGASVVGPLLPRSPCAEVPWARAVPTRDAYLATFTTSFKVTTTPRPDRSAFIRWYQRALAAEQAQAKRDLDRQMYG